ncbi:DNA-binding protein [Streptomyces albus subsp. albus]|nr:DNA-binding protein [Streptomyces albus subsp. albus]
MAVENAQPPMAWRYCGNQIKLWRTHAQVSREELAKEVGYSAEYVKSMEQGRRKPTNLLLLVADQVCRAHGMLLAGEEYLQPEKFASYSADYMLYEVDAIALKFYQALLVPGLLQTEAYARSLIVGHWPPLDDATIERRIKSRIERQPLLDKTTTAFNFVISEGVLKNPIAGEEEYKEQLLRILERGEQRNVDIQVLPASKRANPALGGPFVLLETTEHEQLAYQEGQLGSALSNDAERVSIVSQRWAKLVQLALDPMETARFIKELVEKL